MMIIVACTSQNIAKKGIARPHIIHVGSATIAIVIVIVIALQNDRRKGKSIPKLRMRLSHLPGLPRRHPRDPFDGRDQCRGTTVATVAMILDGIVPKTKRRPSHRRSHSLAAVLFTAVEQHGRRDDLPSLVVVVVVVVAVVWEGHAPRPPGLVRQKSAQFFGKGHSVSQQPRPRHHGGMGIGGEKESFRRGGGGIGIGGNGLKAQTEPRVRGDGDGISSGHGEDGASVEFGGV
mmetsp:Transcript_29673/g.56501  ORF Transcript_29673/g.56501 Transcript_29673/m.56501 type:complete len:233 (-) Transcript_29673:166-864(-)